MNSYVQTREKVPEFPRTRPLPMSLRSADRGEARGAIHYIVPSVGAAGRRSDHCSTSARPLLDLCSTARRGFLRDLQEGIGAGNLFLTGHFFLPCCIQ